MEKLLKEIIEGKKELDKHKSGNYYLYSSIRGKGTKSYVTKRIDLLREQLLEIKKEIKNY